MQSKYPSITVEELRQHLACFPDDWTIDFCGLEFYRAKARGEKHLQIEFTQLVYKTEDGQVIIENI
jgi:hypothetical protein